jgi:hypothetical protein
VSINLKDLTPPDATHMIDFADTIIQYGTEKAEIILDDKDKTIKKHGMKIGCGVKLLLNNK